MDDLQRWPEDLVPKPHEDSETATENAASVRNAVAISLAIG